MYRLDSNYMVALAGGSSFYLHVNGPHQQISVVDAIKPIKHSEASLLHIDPPLNATRHVRPIFLQKKYEKLLYYTPENVINSHARFMAKNIFSTLKNLFTLLKEGGIVNFCISTSLYFL